MSKKRIEDKDLSKIAGGAGVSDSGEGKGGGTSIAEVTNTTTRPDIREIGLD